MARKSSEKIAFMHTFFGVDEAGNICKHCNHFQRWQAGNKRVRKCEVYGLSNSEATDWNASFTACGCFDITTPYRDLYKQFVSTATSQWRLEANRANQLASGQIEIIID